MSFFICGTDTNAGKTLASALLLRELHKIGQTIFYWKPVQTGRFDDDSATAQKLSGVPQDYFLPKYCHLQEPLSPHRAAELEDTRILLPDLLEAFRGYQKKYNCIIEGAGGLLVPLNRQETWLDFLQKSRLPVVLVARSNLGTINHSLLTLYCLQTAKIPVLGIVFFGKENPDNLKTVCDFANVACLGAFELTTNGMEKNFQLWHKLNVQALV